MPAIFTPSRWKMQGPVDEEIILSIRRKNVDPFKVKIKRAIIKIRSVRFEAIDDIGYIRITTFNQQTTPGLKKAISQLRKEIGSSLSGFILDLRNNPGGLLNQAISVSDIFLNHGEIVSTRGDPNNTARVHAKPGDLTDGSKLIVLINTGSASASEIVAGALQDHRRAIILGTQSFGKGSVQTIVPLSNDVAMRLTTARYYTPSGKSIQKTGISPDIVVNAAKIEKNERSKQRREADLRGALENIDEKKRKDKLGKSKDVRPTAERASTDYQLARAVDLLLACRYLKTNSKLKFSSLISRLRNVLNGPKSKRTNRNDWEGILMKKTTNQIKPRLIKTAGVDFIQHHPNFFGGAGIIFGWVLVNAEKTIEKE